MKRTKCASPVPPRIAALATLAILRLSILPIEAQEAGGEAPGRRRAEVLDGLARYAPWEPPERWLHELGSAGERNGLLRRRMVETASWIEFLSFANALDWSGEERAATIEFLLRSLPGLRSAKARQNALFLVALTDPQARRTLGALLVDADGLSPEDRLDARCALAALGDPREVEWFEKEFPGSPAFVGRPVFSFSDYRKEESLDANRPTVRSYRFWEVLFREPYFKPLKMLSRAGIYSMNARDLSAGEKELLLARLLPAFIARWPGHPGSDDLALRLMNQAISRRDLKEVYLWAQRASLYPDEDCQKTAVRILKALADSQLTVETLAEVLASDPKGQNREFLRYQRFIRTARESAAAAIDLLDGLAAAEPGGVFAQARRQAAGIEPPQALRDGIREELTLEIIRHYPERSRRLAETRYEQPREPGEDQHLQVLTAREQEVVRRTRLERKDSVRLDSAKLARQYRLLLELANLEAMERAAVDREVRADLRYRQAKMRYREGDLVFPIWTDQTQAWGHALNAARYDAGADRRLEEYVARAFGLRRAYEVLSSILADYPAYRGRHHVLFHMAQSYARLMDYPPAKAVDAWVFPDLPPAGSREGKDEYAHRRVGELFRRVVEEFPESEWSEEAERGAAYRFKMARILRVRREKAERQAEAAKERPRPGREF